MMYLVRAIYRNESVACWMIYRKNDISLRRYIARTIHRRDIEENRQYLVELSLQRIAYMCDISPRYHRYIARTKSAIQQLSFALLFYNTVQYENCRPKALQLLEYKRKHLKALRQKHWEVAPKPPGKEASPGRKVLARKCQDCWRSWRILGNLDQDL